MLVYHLINGWKIGLDTDSSSLPDTRYGTGLKDQDSIHKRYFEYIFEYIIEYLPRFVHYHAFRFGHKL